MEQRKEFIIAASAEDANISQLCREFGISRKTGHKWINRAELGLPLCDQSRRPHRQPSKTAVEIEQRIIQMRLDHPAWGGKTIWAALEAAGVDGLPSTKTCCNILKRNGLIDPAESAKHTAFQRFEKEYCNEMWQTDFKGDFLLRNGVRCYPLTILDDHSRFNIRIEPKTSATGVKDSFIRAFQEFGLPNSVLSDNGAQFAGAHRGLSQFERFLMDLDILPIHGRPIHPQTQGKIERFHRTLKKEALRITPANMEEARIRLENWRWVYNEIRPHHSLGLRTPSSVYQPSTRSYYEPKPYIYDEGAKLIKVNNWGYIRFGPMQLFLSEAMADTHVEIRFDDNDTFSILYRNYKIASVDAIEQKLIERHIRRL
jgi:transposase InsO family protein